MGELCLHRSRRR
jgi:hypothetical protein